MGNNESTPVNLDQENKNQNVNQSKELKDNECDKIKIDESTETMNSLKENVNINNNIIQPNNSSKLTNDKLNNDSLNDDLIRLSDTFESFKENEIIDNLNQSNDKLIDQSQATIYNSIESNDNSINLIKSNYSNNESNDKSIRSNDSTNESSNLNQFINQSDNFNLKSTYKSEKILDNSTKSDHASTIKFNLKEKNDISIDDLVIRQESKLSQSAPNLDESNLNQISKKFNFQLIKDKNKLHHYNHYDLNDKQIGRLDESSNYYNLDCRTDEDTALFERSDPVENLNENAIEYLINFPSYTHQRRSRYCERGNQLIETNSNQFEQRKDKSKNFMNDKISNEMINFSGPLLNDSIESNSIDNSKLITDDQLNNCTLCEESLQNQSNDVFVKMDLNKKSNSGSNVGFLYKNKDNLDLIESVEISADLDYNQMDLNSNTDIKRDSKVLFSKDEPPEDEIIAFNLPPPDYSVASMLEQNEFAVSDIYQMARELKRTYLFKILIMGDTNTGKTSFIKRFTCNATPRGNYTPTVGLEFFMKILNFKDEQREIKLQLWDISHGEKNQNSLSKLYFRDAVGALVFFDCSREISLKNVDKWKEQLDSNVRLSDGSKLPTILIGNKSDLKKDGLCRDQAYIKEICSQYEFNEYFLTSAKKNENIKESINCLIKLIFESRMEFYYNQENNIKLNESEETPKSGFKCFC